MNMLIFKFFTNFGETKHGDSVREAEGIREITPNWFREEFADWFRNN